MLGKWEFSYDFQSDDKVVIYGAGICGQALYRQYRLAGKEDCVVAWLDKDYKAKSLSCLCDIASPDKLLNMQYDYIIIAVIEEGLAKEIKAELVSKWKIKEEKILWDEVVYDAKKLPFVM
jgi:shikimate 5-dehydrogenase